MSARASRYLIPRPRGVVQAMRTHADDPRRRLVLALLRGGTDAPMQLGELGRAAGLPDARAVGALLFRLQREEWIDGGIEPLPLPDAPLAAVLPALLAQLSTGGRAVLSTADGLVYARVGLEKRDADDLAVLGAALHTLRRRAARDSLASGDAPFAWGLIDPSDRARLVIMPLYFGRRCLQLALGAEPRLETEAFVQLVALLSRRYEGDRGIAEEAPA